MKKKKSDSKESLVPKKAAKGERKKVATGAKNAKSAVRKKY